MLRLVPLLLAVSLYVLVVSPFFEGEPALLVVKLRHPGWICILLVGFYTVPTTPRAALASLRSFVCLFLCLPFSVFTPGDWLFLVPRPGASLGSPALLPLWRQHRASIRMEIKGLQARKTFKHGNGRTGVAKTFLGCRSVFSPRQRRPLSLRARTHTRNSLDAKRAHMRGQY